jgi:WhiB family redox-sensing transcriptional regulator
MDWSDLAACRDVDPELFFPITSKGPGAFEIARARSVCRGCSVRPECLDWALDREILHGVWGGLSEDERIDILRSRRVRHADHGYAGELTRTADAGVRVSSLS